MAETTNPRHPHGDEPHGHGHEPDVNPGVSYETRDVNVFQISAFGIGLLLACIVTVFAMWVMFDFLFKREDAILNGYGWVDPNKGIVRIPIAQAIDIVAQKGLPSKPSPAGMENDGYRTIPEDSSSGRTLEKIAQ